MTCSETYCTRPSRTKGLCQKHYKRLWRNGSLEPVRVPRDGQCSVEGCEKEIYAKRLCGMHYQRKRTTGDVGPAGSLRGRGRITDKGYREITVDGRKILEHRHVMQQHLGRALLPEETVHHIHGDRLDNRIEKLELWSSSHPAGQRVSDKVEWAKELLRLYEPDALREV